VYRLLALDLDGTLLRHDKTVDPRDAEAIHALRARGVTVTIITGRLRTGSISAARACGIEGLIGCMEGSHLTTVDGASTHTHRPIAPRNVELLRDAFERHRLAPFVFDRDGIHHTRAGETYAPYITTWSPNLTMYEEKIAWHPEPLAAVGVGSRDEVMAAHDAVKREDLFAVSFEVYSRPGTYALLSRAMGPTKGTALRSLCEEYGCTVEQAVVVGDWLNDVPMFEVAGRSFAMGGAPPQVAEKATEQLERLTGAGGGIAEAIARAF
jgi:Cof subfamily protein (haloacid dehalogenase superfamily)